MKNLIVILAMILTTSLSAQKIDGFYSGVLRNDSANRMIQQYELAIAMYKGKISGYSYVTFIVNDTFYYGIRQVKGEIIGDSMIIEDDKFVANNFPESPAKKVKRTITIPLHGQDSLTLISGRWQTNRTKIYYSVPGQIDLAKSSDSAHSPLINHLKELQIIPSYNSYASTAVAKNETNKKQRREEKDKEKRLAKEEAPAIVKNDAAPAVAVTTEEPRRRKKEEKTEAIAVAEKTTAGPIPTATAVAKIPFDQRRMGAEQRVEVSSDSLVLAFYDNGVVDGDSISVYVNGEAVISGARLTTTATKKTININGSDEVRLVLVAENMGSIPPNTGLLSIMDGDTRYQVNFSADMQTNASIVIRRKKK